MTTVQITLPNELAQTAANAGLLSTEALEAMLRDQLRRRAGQELQAMWQRGPQQALTPELASSCKTCSVSAFAAFRVPSLNA